MYAASITKIISKQASWKIMDDNFYLFLFNFTGYICDRGGVLKNGCCDLDSEKTRRYYCETCDTSHCCVLYEDCVSCCLDPGKVSHI